MPNCSQVLFYILFTQVADYIAWLPIQPPWNMPRANLRLPSHRTASNPELHFLSAISYHPFPPGTTDTIQCLANFQPYAGAQKKKKKKKIECRKGGHLASSGAPRGFLRTLLVDQRKSKSPSASSHKWWITGISVECCTVGLNSSTPGCAHWSTGQDSPPDQLILLRGEVSRASLMAQW